MPHARFASDGKSFTLSLDVVTMVGHEYALFQDAAGSWRFPGGVFEAGEAPAAAARRIVEEWTGTTGAKTELVDFRNETGPAGWELSLVFRAMLVEEPKPTKVALASKRLPRMGLPEKLGPLAGKQVEEALKSSLSYKLTRA